MYSQITNRKGEKLYILTVVYTNDIKPYIKVNTWEKMQRLVLSNDNRTR